MATRSRKNSCGFTLYEFAVSAGLLALLAGTLLARTLFYHEEAERVAAQQLVATLRAGLVARVHEIRKTEGERGLRVLLEENPLDWLTKKPDNYLGEYYSPDLEKMPSGNWVFDRRDKMLVYLLSSHKSFSSDMPNLLKFKVEFADLPIQDGLAKGSREVSRSVVLHQIIDEAATGMDK